MRQETKDKNIAAEKFLAAETKMTITHLTPEEVAAWQKAAAPAIDSYVKSSGDAGADLVKAVQALY
jgi:C4-dicarboxylate-binding protein DctP